MISVDQENKVTVRRFDLPKDLLNQFILASNEIASLEKCIHAAKDQDERGFWREMYVRENMFFQTILMPKVMDIACLAPHEAMYLVGSPNINIWTNSLILVFESSLEDENEKQKKRMRKGDLN